MAGKQIFDTINYDEIKQAIKSKKVRALFAESLSNPECVVSDIEKLSELVLDEGIPLIIDNTIATQAICQPANYGARMQKHMSNADEVANFLINQDKVDSVSWSGFQNNKSYKLAKKYFKFGFE